MRTSAHLDNILHYDHWYLWAAAAVLLSMMMMEIRDHNLDLHWHRIMTSASTDTQRAVSDTFDQEISPLEVCSMSEEMVMAHPGTGHTLHSPDQRASPDWHHSEQAAAAGECWAELSYWTLVRSHTSHRASVSSGAGRSEAMVPATADTSGVSSPGALIGGGGGWRQCRAQISDPCCQVSDMLTLHSTSHTPEWNINIKSSWLLLSTSDIRQPTSPTSPATLSNLESKVLMLWSSIMVSGHDTAPALHQCHRSQVSIFSVSTADQLETAQ